jgi:hypothetical protein
MNDLATISPDVQATLERLTEASTSLLILAYEQKAEVAAALERLGGPPAREAIAAYLRTASNRDLRQALIAARGAQGAAVLATKLNRDLAALGKVRPALNGRTRAHAGNGTSGAAAHL